DVGVPTKTDTGPTVVADNRVADLPATGTGVNGATLRSRLVVLDDQVVDDDVRARHVVLEGEDCPPAPIHDSSSSSNVLVSRFRVDMAGGVGGGVRTGQQVEGCSRRMAVGDVVKVFTGRDDDSTRR